MQTMQTMQASLHPKEYPKSAAFGPEEANCAVAKTSTQRQAVLPDVPLSCLAL
jgi:hypothetical protein